jgi:hypothetical protein
LLGEHRVKKMGIKIDERRTTLSKGHVGEQEIVIGWRFSVGRWKAKRSEMFLRLIQGPKKHHSTSPKQQNVVKALEHRQTWLLDTHNNT